MEACGSAHYWGREAQMRGHRVVLLPPHVVRPYVVRNKTDRTSKAALEGERKQVTVLFADLKGSMGADSKPTKPTKPQRATPRAESAFWRPLPLKHTATHNTVSWINSA
jgi:hypothetical protein